jgi:hypothetical protein
MPRLPALPSRRLPIDVARRYAGKPSHEQPRALRDPEAERARRAKREAAGWYFWGTEAVDPLTSVGQQDLRPTQKPMIFLAGN